MSFLHCYYGLLKWSKSCYIPIYPGSRNEDDMNQSKILVVEDDHDIAQLLAITMKKAGYEVAVTENGYEALTAIRRHPPDLVILDLMIPGIDGFEVCKEMKRDPKTGAVPVLIVTARGEEIDRIIGLELGADDYVVKPFSPGNSFCGCEQSCAVPVRNITPLRSSSRKGWKSTPKGIGSA